MGKHRKKRTWIGYSIALVIILFSGVLIAAGFGPGNFSYWSSGTLTIHPPFENTLLFINEKERGLISSTSPHIINYLKPDSYALLIVKDGYWPWTKEVAVEADTEISVYPFLAPMLPRTEVINLSDPELDEIEALFSATNSPDLISPSEMLRLEKRGGVVSVHWLGSEEATPDYFCDDEDACTTSIDIFTGASSSLKSVRFYPNRDDIAVITVDNAVYALEIDSSNIQNFQPLYIGMTPTTAVDRSSNALFVRDGVVIYRLLP